ncbi:MAG: hypothetical protein ACRCU2_10955, partial [Planktothrix sp.]
MSQPISLAQFWTYLSECARLFYWAYVKPLTFKRWLGDIDPELKPRDNPFSKQQEFAQNPPLRRYAYQIWWLSLTVPFLTVLVVAPIYSIATGEPFNGLRSSLFLLGWTIGLLLDRENYQKQSHWFHGLLLILVIVVFLILAIVVFLFQVISRFTPEAEALRQSLFSSPLLMALWAIELSVVLSLMFGMAFGVIFGVIFGAVLGVLLGVVSDAALAVVLSAILFLVVLFVVSWTVFIVLLLIELQQIKEWKSLSVLALTTAFYVMLGIGFDVALGIASGIEFGIASDVASDVILGLLLALALILGVLRVYFWIPELLWSLALFLISRQGSASKTLPYLPPRFDELIYLPLPFLDTLIIESYPENPAAARQTIDYLIT